MTRESVYAAVFAFFSALTTGGSPSFKKATRRTDVWENVAAEDQPALLQRQKHEDVVRMRGLPPKWTLHIDLLLYVHTGQINDPNIVPSQVLNPLIDLIDGALTVNDNANNVCTLGGLVSHCFIDGTVEIFEGNLGDQAVAVIPISIVVPT